MGKQLTDEEFAAKIEAEGGPWEALEYGLKVEDLEDPESDLGLLWDEFAQRSRSLPRLVSKIEDACDELWDERLS